MYLRLIKEMPKHDVGELVFLNNVENSFFYEWVENPNYILPRDIVEDTEFFEPVIIDWVKGEKIFFVSSQGTIIEQLFNPKMHLNLVLIGNAFKEKESAEWFLDKCDNLLNDDIIIAERNEILKALAILKDKKNKNVNEVIDILSKIIE
jgi:hypothetical protein